MSSPEDRSLSAESLFADWLARREAGEQPDFEQLCRERADCSAELRELHARWELVGRASGPTPRGAASAEILARLAGRVPESARYRLEGEIGHGGMGMVLGVWDEDLGRHLAMKVLHPRGAALGTPRSGRKDDPRLLARFLEEARVTAQLDHPGIAPVHELGLDADGRVYFTMKLVKGRTLAEVLDEMALGAGGWTQPRVLSLLLKVCDAMSYAHAKSVIHRDLKPTNIMVGRHGEVFVMDWGLARILGREDERDLRLRAAAPLMTTEVRGARREEGSDTPDSSLCTLDGDVVGTPAYMPPEQAEGRLDEMGPHSDVYALGAMLYLLVAGHPPYLPPGRRATNYAVWRWVQEGPPKPLHEAAPSAPSELVAICEKAMARGILERYASIAELAEDLTAYLEGRVVRAYETGAWAEARKWARRNRALAGSLAAVLVLALGGAGLAAYVQAKGRKAAEAHRRVAEANEQRALAGEKLAAENARIASERADDVMRLSALQDLDDLIAEADHLWPPYPEAIDAYQIWIAKAQGLVAELPQHRAKRQELASQGGERWWNGQLNKLVEGLGNLEARLLAADTVTPEHGWSIAKRLAFAEELERSFAPGGAYRERWERDLPSIRAAYPGFDLGPQIGLVPLGPDPDSGLWEFAHLVSGEPPQRGIDGRLVCSEETSVVLVLLPGGRFWMGAQASDPSGRNYDPRCAQDESPVHLVELSAFFLSKYELTQAQWERLSGANPSTYQGIFPSRWPRHPVEQVSWPDCMQWLSRAGLSLPSEAQWEYSARAGTDTPWWTGVDRESLRERQAVNIADQAAARSGASWEDIRDWPELDDGHAVHAPVGSFAPNPFGLHEMPGNVWEWCLDGYQAGFYERSPAVDPVAPAQGVAPRVVRGGAFGGTALVVRSAYRGNAVPSRVDYDLGLRPARSIDERR